MFDFDLISSCDDIARHRFTYKAERTDQWRSHADAAMRNEHWEGDCDDLASTVLEILLKTMPSSTWHRAYRLCVRSPSCPPSVSYDHMVAAAFTGDGRLVIFGDTFGPPHFAVRSKHKIKRYAQVSEGTVWRNGEPAFSG